MSTITEELPDTDIETSDSVESESEVTPTLEIESIDTSDESEEPEIPTILRTRDSGTWEIYTCPWGKYIRPTDDPEANTIITEDHLKHFEIAENIHRIPADLWSRWVKLCFHYVDKVSSSVEVSVRILRSDSDPSQYMFVVPTQNVSGAAVRAENFDNCIDLTTGQEFTQYPPSGWIPVGSSHSHNTMNAFFSGVDDKYELDDPGIHLVVGGICTETMQYQIAASVVGSHRRFTFHYDKLVDATPAPGVDFHPDVLTYVDYSTPVYTYQYGKLGGAITLVQQPKGTWNGKTGYDSDYYDSGNLKNLNGNSYNSYEEYWTKKVWGGNYDPDQYADPFYYNESGGITSAAGNSAMDVWNITDIIKDFVAANRNDPAILRELTNELWQLAGNLELLLNP